MPTIRQSDVIGVEFTGFAPIWSSIPDQSGSVGDAFSSLDLASYLNDGGLTATITAELVMAINPVSADDIDLPFDAIWTGGAASPTRLYFISSSTAYAFDYDGNRQSGDDLRNVLRAGAFSTETRLYFVGPANNFLMAFDFSGNRQTSDDITSLSSPLPGNYTGGFATDTRIYITYFRLITGGGVINTAYAFDLDGNRQTVDNITYSGTSRWQGGFATATRLYFVNGHTQTLMAYDHNGNRQMSDDISLPPGASLGALDTGMAVAMENDRIYVVDSTNNIAVAHTIHDDLPVGLSLADDDVTGTPTLEQTFTATFKATNSAGSDTVDIDFAIAA